jgi:hypothetical protein
MLLQYVRKGGGASSSIHAQVETHTMLMHAQKSIEILCNIQNIFTFENSPVAGLICPTIIAYILVAHLNTSPDLHGQFTKVCHVIHDHCQNIPTARVVLAGLILMGRKHHVDFTNETRTYLEDLSFADLRLHSIPTALPILLHIGERTDTIDDVMLRFKALLPSAVRKAS